MNNLKKKIIIVGFGLIGLLGGLKLGKEVHDYQMSYRTEYRTVSNKQHWRAVRKKVKEKKTCYPLMGLGMFVLGMSGLMTGFYTGYFTTEYKEARHIGETRKRAFSLASHKTWLELSKDSCGAHSWTTGLADGGPPEG